MSSQYDLDSISKGQSDLLFSGYIIDTLIDGTITKDTSRALITLDLSKFSDYDIWLRNTWSEADIDTLIYAIPNQFGSETPRVIAELKRKAYRDSEEGYEYYPYGYYTLETKIRSQDLKGKWIGENYLTFTSSQLVKDELE